MDEKYKVLRLHKDEHIILSPSIKGDANFRQIVRCQNEYHEDIYLVLQVNWVNRFPNFAIELKGNTTIKGQYYHFELESGYQDRGNNVVKLTPIFAGDTQSATLP